MKEKLFGSNLLPVLAVAAALGMPGFAAAVQVNVGWTLAGNGRNAVIDVASTFGTKSTPVAGISDGITTVWKWDAVNAKWAFFTPTMDSNQLATYSASKGYAVLKSILPGEGYWVNASKPVTVPDPVGQPFLLNKWNLTGGWNLVSTGANVTPGQFSTAIAPFTATTVWAWDPVSAGWYFYAPSLNANGTLASYITSKGYKTFTPPLADGLGFWVNRAAVTGSPTASLPPLDQAKQMFAELRTTVNSWVDTSKTGALNDQLARMSNDVHANPQGGVDKAVQRASVIGDMIKMYEDAKAYTATNTNGLIVGPANGAGSYLVSQNNFNFPYASVYGGGSSTYCWADSAIPASVTKITCKYAGSNAFNGSILKLVTLVLTPAATANSYTYTATRVNTSVTFGPSGPVLGTLVLATDSLSHPFPVGTGSVSKTVAGNNITNLAFNGTFPPFNPVVIAGITVGLDSGAVTVTLNMVRSALPTANTYRYTLNGSVVVPGLVSPTDVTVLDPNKVVTLSLDTGTYVDMDETNSATTGSKPLAVNFAGTAQTLATRFTGSVLAKSFMSDADGMNWAPTDMTAVGTFTDTSAGGAGTILGGTLTATDTTYGLYHSMQQPSATNFKHAVIKLTNGALQLPSRPAMGLTLTGTVTGPSASTISGQYTYDNGLLISLSGTNDGNNSPADSLTITNQDGVTVSFPHVGISPISKGATSLGYISNGIINYTDQTFESLK